MLAIGRSIGVLGVLLLLIVTAHRANAFIQLGGGTSGGGGGPACVYYISSTGSDSNSGTTSGSPWSINALNSKETTYAGKVVCFESGTYNIATLYNGAAANANFSSYSNWVTDAQFGDGYTPLFNVKDGSSGAPTDLVAQNGHGTVTFVVNNGATYPEAQPFMGDHVTAPTGGGYITYDGLIFSGCGGKCVMLGTLQNYGTYAYNGYIVQNDEWTGQNASAAPGGVNYYAIECNSATGTLIQNNYFHDAVGWAGPKNGDHFNSINQWACQGSTIQNNTAINVPGFYGKEDDNQGATVRWNYYDGTGWTNVFFYQDGSGPPNGTTLTQTTYIYQNIAIGVSVLDLEASLGGSGWTTALQVYNNDLIYDATQSNALALRAMTQSGQRRLFTAYNNLFVANGQTSAGYGFISFTIDGATLIDYNLYGFAQWFTTPTNYPAGSNYTSLGGTGVTSLATWQSDMAGATGAEAHSAIATPTFTGTGTDSQKWQLTSGSAGKSTSANPGSSNGTTGGTAVDMGAWGGATPPSSIGASIGP